MVYTSNENICALVIFDTPEASWQLTRATTSSSSGVSGVGSARRRDLATPPNTYFLQKNFFEK